MEAAEEWAVKRLGLGWIAEVAGRNLLGELDLPKCPCLPWESKNSIDSERGALDGKGKEVNVTGPVPGENVDDDAGAQDEIGHEAFKGFVFDGRTKL